MTTRVTSKGNVRYIIHNGMIYTDRLLSFERMAEREREIIRIHVYAVRGEKDRIMRKWRFRLRNNAARRAERWENRA